MLDHITVDAYGEHQPLASLAQVQLRSPTLFVLSPFDAAVSVTGVAAAITPPPPPLPLLTHIISALPALTQLSPAIASAVRDAGLNLNPVIEALAIKVPVPKPSRETRDANAKLAGKIAEAAKAAIRRQRQTALDALKKADGASAPLRSRWRSEDNCRVEGRGRPRRALHAHVRPHDPGLSKDDLFRATKELTEVATTATEEVSKIAERKRAEIEAA